MQPCSREMQGGLNSLLNSSSSQISLQDLQPSPQIQNPHMNQQIPHFDPITSHDDFLEQILSSCSWQDLNPSKPLWDPTPNDPDLSDETTPSDNNNNNNISFTYDDHSTLASKFHNHQISASNTKNALMLPHQLLVSRTPDSSSLLHMPLPANDVVNASPFKPPNPVGEASLQALFNGFTGSPHGVGQTSHQTQHFQHPEGSSNPMHGQNFGATGAGGATNQAPASGGAGGAPAQPRQRVRARRGQATDPHSIAERLRRERIAERMKALQELVPNANKTDKASMLDEIIDYVKFLQLQVKVLSMSRLGGAAVVAPRVNDMSSEGGGDCIQAKGNGEGGGAHGSNSKANNNQTTATTSNDSLTMTEHQVAKLMEEDMGSAMQYLQGKGLCLMPISLATAISTATCQPRNPLIHSAAADGPSSPSMSVLTVQSAVACNDAAAKDAASVSKP